MEKWYELDKIDNSNPENVWMNMLTSSIYIPNSDDEKMINKISSNHEHMLGFLFQIIINKNKTKLNPKLNYTNLLKKFDKITSITLKNDPLIMGIESFEKINDEIGLDKYDWAKIIEITDTKSLQDYIEKRIVTTLHHLEYWQDKKQKKFIEYIVEPCVEAMNINMSSYVAQSLLNNIINKMLKEEIPKVSDNALKILINRGEVNYALQYLLEHDIENTVLKKPTYLKYISKENVELIIEKADANRININNLYLPYGNKDDKNYKIEKELRNKVYEKFLKRDEDYIKVYLNVGDTGWSNEFINEKIENISKDAKKCEEILVYWIENIFKEKVTVLNSLKNTLTNEQINTLINGLYERKYTATIIDLYNGKKSNQEEIGYKLLKEINENNLYNKNIKIPFFKNLLNKSKMTNEYLLEYYLNKDYDSILNLDEKELINYINKSKTYVYKNNFLKNCFYPYKVNKKITGSLLNFAIDSIVLYNSKYFEEAIEIIKDWFLNIQYNKKIDKNLKNMIDATSMEKIIQNKQLLSVMGDTILESINKIEEIWNIQVNKKLLINEIDFNKIKFKYEYEKKDEEMSIDLAEEYKVKLIKIDQYSRIGIVAPVKEEKEYNFWNELIKQKTKEGKRVFSNEEINLILDKVNINDSSVRARLMVSLFEDEKENNKFIKELIKEDEKYFENLIERIIENASDVELIDITKKLFILKSEIEFNEELLMKVYNKSSKENIEPELIKKAQIISLMEEKELNDINVACNLIKRNKNNFYKLGKQLIEFLQLDTDNSEKILSKYNEKNIEGLFGYFKRKEKEVLQIKINKAVEYNNKQQVIPNEIKEQISKININRLNEEEKENVEKIINKLMNINKELLKDLSLTENTELKRCMETTFIDIIKMYSKLNENDKKDNPELIENFNEIMNYCEDQVDRVISKNKSIKPKI